MALSEKEILEAFERTGAVLKGHFLLTSGRHSDTYMQCAKLFVSPADSVLLLTDLCKKLEKYQPDVIVSPAVGGIIMGYEVARQMGKNNIFAERVDGAMTLRRGFSIKKGDRAVVVEDVVTTGGSVKEVVELVKALGGEVEAVAAIVDRSNGKVEFGVPFESLLSIEVKSFDAEECPICKTGLPAIKPGSRNLK